MRSDADSPLAQDLQGIMSLSPGQPHPPLDMSYR